MSLYRPADLVVPAAWSKDELVAAAARHTATVFFDTMSAPGAASAVWYDDRRESLLLCRDRVGSGLALEFDEQNALRTIRTRHGSWRFAAVTVLDEERFAPLAAEFQSHFEFDAAPVGVAADGGVVRAVVSIDGIRLPECTPARDGVVDPLKANLAWLNASPHRPLAVMWAAAYAQGVAPAPVPQPAGGSLDGRRATAGGRPADAAAL